MQLLPYLFSFILFFATSLLNELGKNKLKYRKTNFLSLIFTGSTVVAEISLILLEGMEAKGMFTTTFTESDSFCKIRRCYLLSFFCMSQKVIVLPMIYYMILPEQKMQMACYKNAMQIIFDSAT